MKYFTIKELCVTAENIPNIPNQGAVRNLEALVANVLDPARELWGKPIRVNSGYRNPVVNRAVGGASNSQHVQGEAADITTGSRESNKLLFEIIRDNLPFDQLINEKDFSWIHVSYRERGNRKQILKLG